MTTRYTLWSLKRLVACTISASLFVFINPAMAQLEEILVTAQKRAESAQDVPITISAFSANQLENSGFDNLSDLTMMSPSMQFGNFGPIAFVTMRGIGNENTTAGGDPGVAVHLDGIYMGRPVASLFSAFDTERVEILRGPQGTLYGRNATGGSINLVTKKPDDEFGGEVDVTYGDYDWLRFRGALNIPLSDTAAARIVVFKEDRDGYTQNSVAGGTEANDADNTGVRAHLSFDLGDNGSLLLSASHIDSGGVGSKPELREAFPGSTTGQNLAGPPGFAFNPRGPFSGIPAGNNYIINRGTGEVAVNDLTPFLEAKNVAESQDNTLTLLSATFEWNFENISFKSITGYVESEFESHADEDYSALDLAELVLTEEAQQFSQEFQLLSNNDGPFQWIAGLYYFKEDATRQSRFFRSRYDVFATTFGVESGFDIGGQVDSESVAVFGQGTYSLSDTLSLTAGLRYTDDEKVGTNLGFQFRGRPYADPVGDSWDELTYRLALDWRMSDNVMLFGSFSTGYKSGGINQVAALSLGATTAIYDPEFVDAIELGIKSTLLDGRLQLNTSIYHNKYEDLQFQIFGLAGPEAFNAEGATVKGLEVELRAALTDTLMIDASLGLTDSAFDAQVINGAQIDGNQVQRTPDTTYSLGLTNDWALGDGSGIRLRLEYSYTDDIFYTAFNRTAGFATPGGNDLAEDYSNLNARLFWFSADEKWTVEASITNLTDEVQEGNVFRGIGFNDVGSGGGMEEITYNPPRQWGLRVGYNF
jgi:iron complex outermembrane recepter protein